MARLKLPSYQEIREMSASKLKKELMRLRGIASKRLTALKKAGKESYLKDIGALTKDFQSDEDELANITLFLRKPFSKVTYINQFEKDMLKTLKEHGYDIDKKDISQFNRFMGEIKAMHKGRRIPDSTRVAETFIQAQRLRMSNRALKGNLDYWRKHLDELQALPTSKAKSTYSAKQIKDRLKAFRKRNK